MPHHFYCRRFFIFSSPRNYSWHGRAWFQCPFLLSSWLLIGGCRAVGSQRVTHLCHPLCQKYLPALTVMRTFVRIRGVKGMWGVQPGCRNGGARVGYRSVIENQPGLCRRGTTPGRCNAAKIYISREIWSFVGSSTQSIVPRRLEKLSRPSIFHIFAPAQYWAWALSK